MGEDLKLASRRTAIFDLKVSGDTESLSVIGVTSGEVAEEPRKSDETLLNTRIIGREFCLFAVPVMSSEDLLRNSRRSAPFAAALVMLLTMNVACSRAETRARTQLAKATATQTGVPQTLPDFPPCPVGNNEIPGTTSSGTSVRKVHLTWIESTSKNDPRFKEIRYCIYRSQDTPVLRKGETPGEAPCKKCQLVTPFPVKGTETFDYKVDDNGQYCYVAIALAKTNERSVFSNPAGATITLAPSSPPFCETPKEKTKGSSIKSQKRK